VRDRRAEDGHHGVADELLDGAAVPLELASQLRVVRRQRGADVLGIELLRLRGEPDQVGEQDRDDLPLLAGLVRRRGAERRAAARAEAGILGVLAPAVRAQHHGYLSRSTV
jgi:hypothetical protein